MHKRWSISWKYTYTYSSSDGEAHVRICEVFYLTTLNISQWLVEYALSDRMDAATGIVRQEMKGRHPNARTISDISMDEVRLHISLFQQLYLTIDEHQARRNIWKLHVSLFLFLSFMKSTWKTAINRHLKRMPIMNGFCC